jgi:hypothetical protein
MWLCFVFFEWIAIYLNDGIVHAHPTPDLTRVYIKDTSKNLFHVSTKRKKLHKIRFEHSAYFGFARVQTQRRRADGRRCVGGVCAEGSRSDRGNRRGAEYTPRCCCLIFVFVASQHTVLRLRSAYHTSASLSIPLRRIQLSRNMKQVLGSGP